MKFVNLALTLLVVLNLNGQEILDVVELSFVKEKVVNNNVALNECSFYTFNCVINECTKEVLISEVIMVDKDNLDTKKYLCNEFKECVKYSCSEFFVIHTILPMYFYSDKNDAEDMRSTKIDMYKSFGYKVKELYFHK